MTDLLIPAPTKASHRATLRTGLLAHLATSALVARARPIPDAELLVPTMVFAPHPDDETLGCGGTILRLRQAGVPVTLVFMTDGRGSHVRWLDPDRLAALRSAEATAAAGCLGVPPEAVIQLGLPDGHLSDRESSATRQVAALLNRYEPAQLLVPYRHEPPLDHVAANRAVHAALCWHRQPVVVKEYPVWIWNHWPWSRPLGGVSRRRDLLRSLRAVAAMTRDFDRCVDIRLQLDGKEAALACHRTQMARPAGHPDWPVLGDVAGGAWLDTFFTGYEIFHSPR